MRPASARRTRTSASEAASDFEAAASASEAFGSGCWRGNGHREAAQGFDPAADKAGKRQKDTDFRFRGNSLKTLALPDNQDVMFSEQAPEGQRLLLLRFSLLRRHHIGGGQSFSCHCFAADAESLVLLAYAYETLSTIVATCACRPCPGARTCSKMPSASDAGVMHAGHATPT